METKHDGSIPFQHVMQMRLLRFREADVRTFFVAEKFSGFEGGRPVDCVVAAFGLRLITLNNIRSLRWIQSPIRNRVRYRFIYSQHRRTLMQAQVMDSLDHTRDFSDLQLG